MAPSDDLDDWERKFTIQNGRLICTNGMIHRSDANHKNGSPKSNPCRDTGASSPSPPRYQQQQRKAMVILNNAPSPSLDEALHPPEISPDSPEASTESTVTPRKYNKPPTSPLPPIPSASARSLPSSYTLASQFLDDPDPESQIVDVESDNEFITGIEGVNAMTLDLPDNQPSPSPSSAYQKEIQLEISRELAAAIEQAPTTEQTPRSETTGKKMKRFDQLTPIEKVLKELSTKAIARRESQSTMLPSCESKSTREIMTKLDSGEVGVGSVSEGVMTSFPCRVMKLSKSFERLMEKDDFDGIILLDEETFAIELLFAWFSRDFDFEITVGTDPVLIHSE